VDKLAFEVVGDKDSDRKFVVGVMGTSVTAGHDNWYRPVIPSCGAGNLIQVLMLTLCSPLPPVHTTAARFNESWSAVLGQWLEPALGAAGVASEVRHADKRKREHGRLPPSFDVKLFSFLAFLSTVLV